MRFPIPPPSRIPASAPSPGNGAGAALQARAGAPVRRPGFTLVEVLFCIAIFAIGFAAIAVIMPAGLVIQKEVEANAEGAIAARNAMEVMKAKGMNTAMTLYQNSGRCMDAISLTDYGERMMAHYGTDYQNSLQPFTFWSASIKTNWDYEGALYGWGTSNITGTNACTSMTQRGASGLQALVPYVDTNQNSVAWRDIYNTCSPSVNCFERAPWQRWVTPWAFGGDMTDLAYGRIHCFKNRPILGFNLGAYTPLDMSYPSSVLDVKNRTHMAQGMFINTSDKYDTGAAYADCGVQHAGFVSWRVAFFGLRKKSGDEWPELGDGNVPSTGYLFANNAYQMRSIGNPGSGVPTTAWARRGCNYPSSGQLPGYGATFQYWFDSNWGAAYGEQLYTPPPTGGDPRNVLPAMRAGALGLATQYAANGWDAPVGRCWYLFYGNGYSVIGPRGYAFPMGLANRPARDPAYAGQANYEGYTIPSLVRPYALVYDRDNDLVLLRYPAVYGDRSDPAWKDSIFRTSSGNITVHSANDRVKDFWDRYPQADPLVHDFRDIDRKLQVGDWFLSSPGGHTMRVREVLDIQAEKARVEAALANGESLDWTDGTYQVVRVTPSLRDTEYCANVPSVLMPLKNTAIQYPPLFQAVVAVPPIGGTANPCNAIENIAANNLVFRPLDNMAE